jgi:hypothetical protein
VVPIVELAVSVVLVPAHTVAIPLMIGVSAGFTVTVATADVVEHPVLLLTVTVYVDVVPGVTSIACVVAPLLHKYV